VTLVTIDHKKSCFTCIIVGLIFELGDVLNTKLIVHPTVLGQGNP
jgi:hypothetical protein